MAKNSLNPKKIKKSLQEIRSAAEGMIYKEIHNSFSKGINENLDIESLMINQPNDIYLRTMYEIVNSIEMFSNKDKIIESKPESIKAFLENAYRKTIVKPDKGKYAFNYKRKDPKYIHFEGEITIEATEEEIKAMRTVFLGGDTTIKIDGKEESLISETNMSHDRDVADLVAKNMSDFLESRWSDIVKEIEKGEK